MDFSLEWLNNKHILVVAVVLIAYLLSKIIKKSIWKISELRQFCEVRVQYVVKTVNIAIIVITMMALTVIYGVKYKELMVFLSSAFAVLGVALFAQWSILSNITASVIIFFSFPYRVGDYIRVVDKDGDISGQIDSITTFHVLIRNIDDEIITYPNSLILQKSVIKLKSMPKKVVEKTEEKS